MIRVGIGGWTYPPWRGTFYPEGLAHARELEYASRRLTSIEINATFYRLQSASTFGRWHDATPGDFVFALKAPRFVTQRKVLAGAGEAIERFIASGIVELGPKLGPINWQFAPTRRFDEIDCAAFLQLLPRRCAGVSLRHVLEVRHPSFVCREFVDLARAHDVGIVAADSADHPLIADASGRLCGLRSRPLGRPCAVLGPGRIAARPAASRARHAQGAGCVRILHRRSEGARTRGGAGIDRAALAGATAPAVITRNRRGSGGERPASA
jgi:uncharacterized protein YecE (DUF72 family)